MSHEYKMLKQTRHALMLAIRLLKAENNESPTLTSAVSFLSKKSRFTNIHFAFVKRQSLFAVETPPRMLNNRQNWVREVLKYIDLIPIRTSEDMQMVNVWRDEIRKIHRDNVRLVVESRINPGHGY